MKKTLLVASILGAVSTMASTSAMAVEGLSANAAVTSNYYWRGTTQTADESAVSGGIDYSDESGFYAGAWLSNVNFGGNAAAELDLYFGYSGEMEGIAYDVGYVYFNYPRKASVTTGMSTALDFGEIYGSVSFDALTLGLAVLANTEGNGTSDFGDSIYVSADYTLEVAEGIEAAFHIGSYSGDFVKAGFGDDYIDLGASISKDGFTFGVVETTLDGSDLGFYVSYAVDFDL
mgnify:CR=1 FL=1